MTEFNDDLDSLIIYEDKNILVVNKPSGLLTIKDGYDPFLPNLYDILIANYQKLWAVHRLDKETSGVLVFAKSADAHRFLNTQFDNRLISKSYNAIVHGVPEWEEKTIDSYLKVNGDRKHRTVVHPEGKKAVTNARIESTFSGLSYLAVKPQTGYTHQIRAHLASVGYPILGDALYTPIAERIHPINIANKTQDVDSARLYLHARSITFIHPSNRDTMTFTAPFDNHFLTARQLFHLIE